MSELSGIRIYYGEIETRKDGTLICSHNFPEELKIKYHFCSDFYLLFQTILPELQVDFWLVDLECFNLCNLNDDDFNKLESYLDSTQCDDSHYMLENSEFLGKFSRLVQDDWNQLCGLKKPLTKKIKELAYHHPFNDISQEIPAEIEVIFDNFDGAYWSFFSKNSSLCKTIKQDLYKRFRKENVEIKVIDISFKESLMKQYA